MIENVVIFLVGMLIIPLLESLARPFEEGFGCGRCKARVSSVYKWRMDAWFLSHVITHPGCVDWSKLLTWRQARFITSILIRSALLVASGVGLIWLVFL